MGRIVGLTFPEEKPKLPENKEPEKRTEKKQTRGTPKKGA